MNGPDTADLVVVGAGAVGAASAYFATLAGLKVVVLDRGPIAGGTSSSGEGNILVSDKEAGPELALAQYSQDVWHDELAEFGPLWEFEAKGGVVVSRSGGEQDALAALAAEQRVNGVAAESLTPQELRALEPELDPALAGGVFYPQDAQVQPMLLVAHLLRLARAGGAQVRQNTLVHSITREKGAVTGVRTAAGHIQAPAVLNAAGTWAGEVAEMAGVTLPVLPRRGFVLVTEPLPPTVHHKVYAAEYVANVGSSDAGLQTSPVVEGTQSGTVLIGSSRERVGFDRTLSIPAVSRLAAAAAALFPILAKARIIRTYSGFRPYCPDHLPVIGADARLEGLWHACGHEGAGIGLSAGTGALIAQAMTGIAPKVDLTPFAPHRFEEGAA